MDQEQQQEQNDNQVADIPTQMPSSAAPFIALIQEIASDNHLAREKAQISLQIQLSYLATEPKLSSILEEIFEYAKNQLSQTYWKQYMSGLFTIRIQVQLHLLKEQECEDTMQKILKYLDDNENKVRDLASDILASIAANHSPCFSLLISYLSKHIQEIFLPFEQTQIPGNNTIPIQGKFHPLQPQQQQYKETLLCEWESPQGVFLEAHFSCLNKSFAQLIERLKNSNVPQAQSLFEKEIIDIISKASLHSLKFIRNASVTFTQLFIEQMGEVQFLQNAQTISDIISRGLSDSYTQVRLQGVKVVKLFLHKCLQNEELKKQFLPQLIYKLSFNIHHPAEGLRSLTRQTWLELFPVGGRELVAANALATTNYYILQSYSRNHEIRQAACICIAEMLSKVLNTTQQCKEEVRSLLPNIIEAVLNCTECETIALVREESFKCMVRIMENASDLVNDQNRFRLKEISSSHLWDQSILVKQNAAAVLAIIFKQSEDEQEKQQFMTELTDQLTNLSKCPIDLFLPNSIKEENHSPAADGMQTLIKKRFVAEYLEGLVALTKEMAYILTKEKSQKIEELCHLINYNLTHIPFEKNENIKENIYNMYAEILTKTLNKKNAKELIEDLLDPIFKDFSNEKINIQRAAKNLIRDLAAFIGPNILKGRIEQHGDNHQMEEYLTLGLV